MRHVAKGLARPCSAWDLILVTGGLQCGNCLASTVPALADRCSELAIDQPCPLRAGDDGICWIHREQKKKLDTQRRQN